MKNKRKKEGKKLIIYRSQCTQDITLILINGIIILCFYVIAIHVSLCTEIIEMVLSQSIKNNFQRWGELITSRLLLLNIKKNLGTF